MKKQRMYRGQEDFQIRRLLRAGFGVEDIQVKMGIHPERTRFVIRQMRATGELAKIYRGAAK